MVKLRWCALISLWVCCGLIPSVQAGLAYNTNISTADIASVLNGPGLNISNVTVTKGVAGQYGVFAGGASIFGVDGGLFMNTGDVGTLQAPNNNAAYSHVTKVIYSDPDLVGISSGAKYDPAIIEFDLLPQGDRLNFVFAFGSDEYPEYVCSRFNDAFGLFVSGPGWSGTRNAAFMPSGDAIAVNNVNAGAAGSKADGTACNLGNTAYFIDNGNGTGSSSTQLDGHTKPVTASLAGLTAGQTYHVKLAIADAGDPGYDSGAAFKWLTSTNSTPVDLSLTASSSRSSPVFNTEVALTYTLTNSSNTSTSLVSVGLEWPNGLTWVSDDTNGAYNSSTHEWNVGTIEANSSKQITIRALVGSDAQYSILGEVNYAFNVDPDSTPFNHLSSPNEDDTAVITLTPQANVIPSIDSNLTLERPENTTDVTTITASDANGDVLTYSISGGADAALFTLNSQTGALQFITPPDYEKPTDADANNVYHVIVSVTDGLASVNQTLAITITDVDENVAPVISSDGGQNAAALSMAENKTAVTTVTATDANDDALTYSISGGADAALFKINSTTGKLVFIKAPDYELPIDADANNVYVVQVSVSDGKLTDKQTLRITITDVYENIAPYITSDGGEAAAYLSVPENQAAVTTVVATDANNDAIVYELGTNGDEALFQINTNTGTLAFIHAPDYEQPLDANQDNIYIVTVIANDGALRTEQVLFITVTDVFENLPPVITSYDGQAVVEVSLDENSVNVGTITATDGNNETLTYSISGGADAALFSINAQTGELQFLAAPDYEKPTDADANNVYEVIVQVTDGHEIAIQQLEISIQNLDDVPYVVLQAKALLQGAYDASTGLMRADLHSLGLLPSLQPYGELKTAFGYATSSDMASPFDYTGKETLTDSVINASGNDAMVDWVLVELRDATDPSQRIAAAAAVLQSDGDIVDAATGSTTLPIEYAQPGNYYVMVRHRSHLAVMSAAPVAVGVDNPPTLDFSDASSEMYGGSAARLISGNIALMWVGDTNNSNTAIAIGPGSDSSVILGAVLVAPENVKVNAAYRLNGYYATDLNMDGSTIYTGPNNDINLLLGNVLVHPNNVTGSMNFIIRGKAPH